MGVLEWLGSWIPAKQKPANKKQPFVVTVDGLIGVGKTDTVKELTRVLEERKFKVVFREEHVQRWLDDRLLQLMYGAGKASNDREVRSAATSVFNILGPMVDFAKRRVENAKLTDVDVVIEERSAATTQQIFNLVSKDPNYAASELLPEHERAMDSLFSFIDSLLDGQLLKPADFMIYLHANEGLCLQRMASRARDSESSSLSAGDMTILKEAHDQFFADYPLPDTHKLKFSSDQAAEELHAAGCTDEIQPVHPSPRQIAVVLADRIEAVIV